jgi:hypothetical protein
MKTKAILAIMLMAGLADATCQTGWDYCANYTLPHDAVVAGTNGNITVIDFSYMFNLENIDGIDYVNSSLQNVWLKIYNTTDTNGARYNNLTLAGGYLATLCEPGTPCRAFMKREGCQAGCVNTSILEICLNGSYNNGRPYQYDYPNSGNNIGIYPILSDFTAYYRRNWTFRDESDASIFSFLGTNTTITTSCDNYASFTYNLTSLGNGSLTIQTKERPKFSTVVVKGATTFSPRIREDKDNFLGDNYYLTKSTTTAQEIEFRLVDYTGGQFYKSTVSFDKAIGTLAPQHIAVHQFGIDNLVYPLLLNGTSYKIVLENNNSVRDLGSVYIRDGTQKDIIVSTPDFTLSSNNWDDLNISIIYDYDLEQISCIYHDTSTITRAEFYVYNISNTAKTLTYNSNATAQSGTITYTASNYTQKYGTLCRITDTKGSRYVEKDIMFRNSSTLYNNFDLELEDTVMGISKETFYIGLSIIPSLILAGIFGMAYAGIAGIVFVLTVMWFTWIGWLSIGWWFLVLMLFLAIAYQLGMNRSAVVT